MTHIYILVIRSAKKENIILFKTLRLAYDYLNERYSGLSDVFIDNFEFLGEELCERAAIAEHIPIEAAWNKDKSWTAAIGRGVVYGPLDEPEVPSELDTA
jgi:hypothetical protein